MNKDKLEQVCRKAGMRPVVREKLGEVDLFVADGFSLAPHRPYWRFGVEPNEFPRGMYTTLWWISKKEENLDVGQPIFFDAMHNPEYSPEDKKQARVNRARFAAVKFLKTRKKMDVERLQYK